MVLVLNLVRIDAVGLYLFSNSSIYCFRMIFFVLTVDLELNLSPFSVFFSLLIIDLLFLLDYSFRIVGGNQLYGFVVDSCFYLEVFGWTEIIEQVLS